MVWFVASDFLTTIWHFTIVNVCVIIIMSICNTQISILLLSFLYLFVEPMITMNESILFKPTQQRPESATVTLTLHASEYKEHELRQMYTKVLTNLTKDDWVLNVT